MKRHRTTRIIQIIPANAWILEYQEAEGKPNTRVRAACFALHDDGEVVLMDVGEDGYVFEAAEMENFVRCYYGGGE